MAKSDFSVINNNLIRDKKMNAYDKTTFIVLCLHADNETGECYPSQKTISEYVGASRPTIIKSLKKLEESGYISIRKTTKGVKTFNVYTILETENEDENDGHDVNDIDTASEPCKRDLHSDVKEVNTNYIQSNYTKENTFLSFQDKKGENATHNQKTLINIPQKKQEKKKTKLSQRETALQKIALAKNNELDWDKITYRDFTFYFLEKHKEILGRATGYNWHTDVTIMRENFLETFDIEKSNACDYIDKILEIYSSHPKRWDVLSFNMIQKNTSLINDLIRKARLKLDEPKEKEYTQEEIRQHEEWKWKMDNIDKLSPDEVF